MEDNMTLLRLSALDRALTLTGIVAGMTDVCQPDQVVQAAKIFESYLLAKEVTDGNAA